MKYIIANFKSHKTTKEIDSWLTSFTAPEGAKIILALPYPYLNLVPKSSLNLGAQEVSPFPAGSYTGAVNATQLADLGVKFCIVGHSERRKYFHETSQDIGNKINELLQANITPVVCVSEQGIAAQFATLDEPSIARCLFAYETLVDIGGTETTPIEKIESTITLLRSYTKNSSLGLLYGGSVNPSNAHTLTNLVDGLLVGSSSLDPIIFTEVIQGFINV